MSRTKLPPRVYFNESRQKWVIRYDGWMRRTPFGLEQKADAEALLTKILGEKSWAHAVRSLRPKPRTPATAPWARSETMGLIYFISCEELANYPVKIGFCAGELGKRLGELQVGNPHPLEVLATVYGSYRQEQSLHGVLADDRIGGEWFRRSPTLERLLGAALIGTLFVENQHSCAAPVPNTQII